MIPRRSLLASASLAGAWLAAAAAKPARAAMPALPPGNRLAFRVMRRGAQIGTHVLQFTPEADGFALALTVRISLSLGPITLFRYHLDGVERWAGGVPVLLQAKTDDDGSPAWINARREGDGLRVTGSATPAYQAPADALPATHWNMAQLRGPLINPQDGKLFRPAVADRGAETIRRADGRGVAARHFALTGDVALDLWYDAERQWSGLEFTASDNSLVRYVLD